jgi:flagellar hook-associated protein 3 FlgL
MQRVSPSSLVAISDSGNDLFMNVKDASIPFAVAKTTQNLGTGVISNPVITDAAKWNSSTNHENFTVKFAVNSVTQVTTYDIVDDQGQSVLTNAAASAAAPLPGTGFQSGVPISIKTNVAGGSDFGATITITGSVQDGDSFTIRPSTPVSVFKTLGDLVLAAEAAVDPTVASQTTTLATAISTALYNIQAAQNNVITARTSIGARLNVIDSLASQNSSRDLSYKETLSNLQEVDYTAAITEMNKHQVTLQAAQKSYVNIAQLSLFNYI